MFVGLDVHKETVQMAAVDTAGELLFNKKIKNTFPDIAKATAKLPKKAKYVMESSSVWYGLYRYMSDELYTWM